MYKDEGYALLNAAFEVYNDRGYGMAEEIYQECMEIELQIRGVVFVSKHTVSGFYKGHELKKRYTPDLFVFGSLVVELKAVAQLAPEHEAQLYNYLRLSMQPIGYLLNFGHRDTLEWKRLIISSASSGRV